ncbi:hypothetical protein MATL_G00118910 [Megalops atlanticus]|uniref:Nuclear mitotic apparatus protein 1 N-terminal hook domain-containing protein n=1 Tax=Megalops atlanticus TaxID=7932 RepID=A0A9D3TBB8_MEGAT|nr:hypothetical protein MATL_G00118910 [Megalops atlanticus]
MALHREKEDSLLAWINSFRLADPVDNIVFLSDGILLVKLIYKLKEQEEEERCSLDQSIQERLEIVSDFLQKDCRYKADRGAIVSWDNILNGINLDVELSKVVMLLMYHAIMNGLLGEDKLDHKTEIQMAAILRFVLNNEDSLYLSDNLEKFLKKPFDFNLSSISSVSSFSDDSPVFIRRRIPEVQFLELTTVASNSVGSPIQEVLNTPQFQLRKLRRQLAQEQDMRDELERELASNSQIITEREAQISQLQHRVQRLLRDHAEQEQDPKELEELQNKNEGLLKRLHEVLKQCQDLKTNKGQMERKIDQLTEENGNLSAQIRDICARLASAHSMVDSLTEEQKASQTDWESKKTFLEAELSRAVSEKECLNEQIQILQGKISILEDELRKAQAQTKEEGEVMGPIMEWERLHHEISELKCRLSQLQENIIQLEQEKAEIQMMLETERTKNENEIIRLQGLISELQQTLHTLQSEKEALEQTSREQWAAMTAQIEALNSEIACLSETVHQRELAVTSLGQQVAEEQRKRGELTKEMEQQEQKARDTIQGLNQQVNHLGSVLKAKEEEALSNAMEWERDREESSRQQATLIEASENATRERDAVLVEYHQFRQEKDEEISNLIQKAQQLEQQWEVELSLSSKLRNEKEGLELKLTSLESAIRDLQNDLEVESRKHKETLAAKLQKDSQMAEEILELGKRIQQLLTEIEAETEALENQLQLAREELSKLRPFKDAKAEMLQVNCDLQEQLTAKSEALDHYKAQVEKAKNHYNGKKQQLLEMTEKAQALGTALENSEQEVKTLKTEKKRLLMELEQAKSLEKNLTLKVNSLQAQVDYADRQLREQTKQGRCDTLKTTTRECKNQKVAEKQQDISGDSLDLSLDDSLNATRRPSGREDSSTPVVRSSERLQAKRRARGGESLETLYFTPMSSRDGAPCKLESSITSMGELTLDSAKKGHSARRRTTQVINITMTKKTPGSSEADPEDSSFYSLHSAQSFPNLASRRGRPISMDFEDNISSDPLQHLPGYRRSTAHSIAPTRSASTFGVDAENEPENTDDWMRIAELQTRNKACPPHLKSSYPIESRPSLGGNPSFTITDDDLRTGDPNETIRRISMLPSQIRESSQFHRLSMLPGQISSGVASQSAVLRPKQSASNVQNTGGATLSLKRSSSDLPGPDTPEAKKISSCFPRPMTPKGRNDRRFVSHNSQNIPPNIPTERRQSMMFSIENTPKKNGKSSLLQKGLNKMRASTRKSPASASKVPGSRKSPRGVKSPYGEKPQRRSPRVSSSKSPKIVSSAKKMMAYRGRMKV